MVDAYRAGRDAGQRGLRFRNPYKGRTGDTVERVLSMCWARGYAAGNPMPTPTDD
jgi:hypothetical protein